MTTPGPAKTPFSVWTRLQSVGYAFAGVGFMLRTQHSAWCHLLVTAALLSLSAFARISMGDWRWIVLALFLVWAAEAVNTAVEYLCDAVSPDYSVAVKRAKDIAAGAVLFSACSAATISALTLWPYLIR